MDMPEMTLLMLVALLAGLLGFWVGARPAKSARQELAAARERAQIAEAELAASRTSHQAQIELLRLGEAEQLKRYEQLSAKVLEQTQSSFFKLAKEQLGHERQLGDKDLNARQKAIQQLVEPLTQTLEKVQGRLHELEKHRASAYQALRQQVDQLQEGNQGLRKETSRLVEALRRPSGRGQWGEIQLKRVVELAGMIEYCDFQTQVHQMDESGSAARPDLIVRLPAGRSIIVDSKAPMDAYLTAIQADDEQIRDQHLERHAKQVITHLRQLGSKAYQKTFDETPEFVVLFLPSEALFAAALEKEPSLIEQALDSNIIPATPTTLIALLRTVAQGWREESLANDAREIAQLGAEIHSRCHTLAGHFNKLGQSLEKSMDYYNRAIGSLESRVMVTARQLEQWSASDDGKRIETLEPRKPEAPRQLPET